MRCQLWKVLLQLLLSIFVGKIKCQEEPTTTAPLIHAVGCKIDFTHGNPYLTAVKTVNEYETFKAGDVVQNFVSITYKCPENFIFEGSPTNLCINGRWVEDHPTCTTHCPNEDIYGSTIQATCEYNDIHVPCNLPIRTGTKARISCKVGYTQPRRQVKEVIVCNEDGKWDYYPFRCVPVCGTSVSNSAPFPVGTGIVDSTLVPWQATIYRYDPECEHYHFKCGGTIISSKVIVSAADCFHDSITKERYNTSSFLVSVGKNFSNFKAKEKRIPQHLNVSEIFIPQRKFTTTSTQPSNIAILVLTDAIKFNEFISPICVEWQDSENQSPTNDVSGRMMGWSYRPKFQSDKDLRISDMATVSYKDCVERIEVEYQSLVHNDKFCGLPYHGQKLIRYAGGSGFFKTKISNGLKTNYLWGITGSGVLNRNCTGCITSIFTNIQFYSTEIIKYVEKNEEELN